MIVRRMAVVLMRHFDWIIYSLETRFFAVVFHSHIFIH